MKGSPPRVAGAPESAPIMATTRPVIGWREWVALPELGIDAIKAKIDTGARSSALHAHEVEVFRRHGHPMVRFKVHPRQRNAKKSVTAEAELVDQRHVRSSSGHASQRPVILTVVELDGTRWTIEVTLTNRDTMGFRMLIGRQGVRGRFVVDPGRSYLRGKRPGQGPPARRPASAGSRTRRGGGS